MSLLYEVNKFGVPMEYPMSQWRCPVTRYSSEERTGQEKGISSIPSTKVRTIWD
jgi:hypothetical protein